MSKYTVNGLVKEVHELAKEKGWWDGVPRSPLEIHMLAVSEIAEATEEARTSNPPFYLDGAKPEGEAVELVDAVIRIMDYFGYRGWDMEQVIEAKMKYNETRSHRHGGKKY